MTDNKKIWVLSRNKLVKEIKRLGFPEELGNEIAKNLGSPKVMDRMTAYLINEKPKSAEIVVDEMLSIMTEIEAWREKKESREANERINEIMEFGLMTDENEDQG